MPPTARRTNHRQAFDDACRILRGIYRLWWSKATVTDPRKVIRVLWKADARFVVIGNFGLVGYRNEPQATQPIEVLVAEVDEKNATGALQAAFPNLVPTNQDWRVSFLDEAIGRKVIELQMSSGRFASLVFRNSVQVDETLRVPTLEMTLAMLFMRMRSEDRGMAFRYQARAEFWNVAETQGDVIDEPKVRRIGNGIKPGIGTKVVAAIRDVRAGKELRIVP